MNIFGVGGMELLIILILMLIVAGPKRMIRWAYVMGQYVAKFRRMWAETVDVLQHEFDDAGVDIKIPRELPTRGSLNKEAAKMLGTVTNPVKETLDQVNMEVADIKKATTVTAETTRTVMRGSNGHTTKRPAVSGGRATAVRKPPASGQGDGFGTWSRHESKPDFGSWAASGQSQDDEE